MPHVLVADASPAVQRAVGVALRDAGHAVLPATDGLQALRAVGERRVDAAVLDARLPLVDGVEVCRRIRADGLRMPVLLVGEDCRVDDRVAGLEAGADDHLAKPFAVRELLARLRAVGRRTGFEPAAEDAVVEYADLRIDRAARRAWRGTRRLELTRTEFGLLEALAEHPGHVLERRRLLIRVWGYDFGPEFNSLGVYVGYLRRKLEEDGEPRLVHNVRGVGYVLRAEERAPAPGGRERSAIR